MALARMNQDELASAAGIGRASLTRILNEDVSAPRDATLKTLRQVLEARNIEFTADQGVRLKPSGYETLIGQAGLHQFFDGVHEHASKHGGTIVQTGVDEKQFLDNLGEDFSADYVRRMQAVHRERKDLKVKAIICEGETDYLAPDYNEYRWISKDTFQAVPFYIYGDNLAIMDFQTIPAPTIFLLKSPAIANAYRKQFDELWNVAREMPSRAKQEKDA